jgi:DNA-binding IclR family transcriptional regulator
MSKIVDRTLDFLELFEKEKRPLSLSEISRLLTIPVSSCHDVLAALQDRGFIYEVSPRGGYYPTLRLHEAGKTIAENDPLLLRADHLLREFRDSINESVLLTKVNGLRGTYLLVFETAHPLRFQKKIGESLTSLHATSAGNAILGSLPDQTLEATLAKLDLTGFTPKTVRNRASLREKISRGRDEGFYVNVNESIDGLTTISAPFTWQQSLYIVTIAAPTSRFQSRIPEAAAKLMEVCRKLEMKTLR